MIKDGSFTWKAYLFIVVVAIAGGLAIHWGLLNFIAPGPKKLSKAAEKEETKYIGMVALQVDQNLGIVPTTFTGDPLANLPGASHHA